MKRKTILSSVVLAAMFGMSAAAHAKNEAPQPPEPEAADCSETCQTQVFEKERSIFLFGEVNSAKAKDLVAAMKFLDSKDSTKPINLYINSGGGEVGAGLAIYEQAMRTRAPLRTICTGEAGSMAAFILTAAGSPGMRIAYPTCRVMQHESSAGANGKVSDIKDLSDDLYQTDQTMNKILADRMGWSPEALERMLERRDLTMSAEQAKELGFVDQIVQPTRQIEPAAKKDRYPGWLCEKLRNPAPYCPAG